jgi:hypothetical protein
MAGESKMQKAVRVLAYLFAVSYLLTLLYVAVDSQTLYQGQWHLQYALASLGLAYLVKFVQSPSVLAVIFASILLPMVKMLLLPAEQALNTIATGSFNLLFLLSYLLVIYQIVKFKRQLKTPPPSKS